MTRDHAEGAVNQIELMFGKNWPREARARLINDMEIESSEAARDAIKILEKDHNYLPSPIALLRLVRECGAAKADRKQEERVRERIKPDPKGFEVFKAMNRLFFSGKVSRQEILDKIKEADKVRPGVGWDLCGANLQKLYQRRGCDMNKPPHVSFDEMEDWRGK